MANVIINNIIREMKTAQICSDQTHKRALNNQNSYDVIRRFYGANSLKHKWALHFDACCKHNFHNRVNLARRFGASESFTQRV